MTRNFVKLSAHGGGRPMDPGGREIARPQSDHGYALDCERCDRARVIGELDSRRETDLLERLPCVEGRARWPGAHDPAQLERGLLDPELRGRLTRAEHPAVRIAAARELVALQIDALRR